MEILKSSIVQLKNEGWSKCPTQIRKDHISELQDFLEEIAQDVSHPSIKRYQEKNIKTSQLMLGRIEMFLETHRVFVRLLQDSLIEEILLQFFGEPGVLLKEKINLKQPGSQGYSPHQDHPAYSMFPVSRYLTLALFIGDIFDSHGALSFAACQHNLGIFPFNERGELKSEAMQNWTWAEALGSAGSLVMFDSFVPHFSKSNDSEKPKPILFLTFNKKSEGNYRKAYFERKEFSLKNPDKESLLYNFANPFSWL